MAKLKFTIEEVKEALTKANGFHSTAAAKLGCDLKTIQNYINRSEILQTTQKDLKHKRDDIVENAIMKGITEGNTSLIIFYAKTQMRDRGYSEKESNSSDNTLKIEHTFVDKKDDDDLDFTL